MPICFQPGKRFPIVLSTDKDSPNPPTFYARAISSGDSLAFLELNCKLRDIAAKQDDSAAGLRAQAEAVGELYKSVEDKIVGWENLIDENGAAVEFGSRPLRSFLNDKELGELAAHCLAGRVAEDDSKKSESPSGSSSA